MATFKFTKTVLENPDNEDAILGIEAELGRQLVVDEVLDLEAYRGLCNGKQCADGEVCVLGNCIKDDLPNQES